MPSLSAAGHALHYLLLMLPTLTATCFAACVALATYESMVGYFFIGVPFALLIAMLLFWCCVNNKEALRRVREPAYRDPRFVSLAAAMQQTVEHVAAEEERRSVSHAVADQRALPDAQLDDLVAWSEEEGGGSGWAQMVRVDDPATIEWVSTQRHLERSPGE